MALASLLACLPRRRHRCLLPPFGSLLPVATRLVSSSAPTTFRRPIAPTRSPQRPASGRPAAGPTAIPAQGVPRREHAFAALEQARPPAWRTSTPRLNIRRRAAILRWAHGRDCSRKSSLGTELLTPFRGASFESVTGARRPCLTPADYVRRQAAASSAVGTAPHADRCRSPRPRPAPGHPPHPNARPLTAINESRSGAGGAAKVARSPTAADTQQEPRTNERCRRRQCLMLGRLQLKHELG